ncbi:BgTH12-07408 [Blumeria graminis f. sp. triticale]|uniref:BgTH12-07408 n=1 Tax=Blumeria graminis f. sp. triticale TaxID=1689686 RepID=A0A9W4GDV5_BLUGR|nr:BgTH12-07408 [Blumeria graminis f. sp. triticale]
MPWRYGLEKLLGKDYKRGSRLQLGLYQIITT